MDIKIYVNNMMIKKHYKIMNSKEKHLMIANKTFVGIYAPNYMAKKKFFILKKEI